MSDVLQSVRRKIIRAMEQEKVFEACITKYRSDGSIEVVPNPDGTQTLHVIKQPPLDISVLAGEVLYHCRSALDHMFFDLVKRTHGGELSADLGRLCQFPLLSAAPTGHNPPIPKDKLFPKEGLFNWVPDEPYAFIEKLQPYNRSDAGHDLLRLLAVLSNIDKHHHITTTVVQAHAREIAFTESGVVSVALSTPLHDGAQINPLWHPPEVMKQGKVKVKRDIHFEIAFDEPEFGPPKCAPLSKVVYSLPTHIYWITVHFQKFLS